MTEDEIRAAAVAEEFRKNPALQDVYDIVQALSRVPADRKSYIAALVAIRSFLHRAVPGISVDRLLHLVAALADLDHGAVADVLKPASFGAGRRSVSSLEWMRRVNAVLAVECRVRAGDEVGVAAQKVAKSSQSHNADTIQNWREELSAGRVRNAMAETLYSSGRRAIAEVGTLDELLVMADIYVILFANPDEASRAYLDPEPS